MAKTDLSAAVLRKYFTYDKDSGLFYRVGQHTPSGRLTTNGYRQIFVLGSRYMAHRLAWLYVHGVWPTDQLDHINQQRDDNRIANLREVSNKQNGENVRMFKHNTSGHKGVSWVKRECKWMASIKHNKRNIYLGRYDDISEAIAAREKAERELFTHSPQDSPNLSEASPSLEVRLRPRAPKTEVVIQ